MRRKSHHYSRRRKSGSNRMVFKRLKMLERAQIGMSFSSGRNKVIHQLEKSYQDLERLRSFFIPAYYHARNWENEALPDLVPNSSWAELEIAHRSKVKSIFTKIEIFSTSDYAMQLKWCPIYFNEYDIMRFPQSLIDGLETNHTLNDLQDNEQTRWMIPKQYSMYFQPRQLRTMTKRFRPTKGKPREIRSGMLAGILLQNASTKAGSFDFKVTTTFSEYQRDPDTFDSGENDQYGADATTNVGS